MCKKNAFGFSLVCVFIFSTCLLFIPSSLSPTDLEPPLLVSGLSHLRFNRYDSFCVNPPLARTMCAIPVETIGYKMDWSDYFVGPGIRTEFSLGNAFVRVNGEEACFFIALARITLMLGCAGFFLSLCLLAYRDIIKLNMLTAFASLTIFSDPNVLAHGTLVSNDAIATAAGCFASLAYWKWLKEPCILNTVIAGVLLGICELTKFSWIVLYPLWLGLLGYFSLIGTISGVNEQRISKMQRSIYFSAIIILSFLVINIIYGFDRSFLAIRQYTFVSGAFSGNSSHEPGNRFQDSIFGDLLVPLPEQYIIGIDLQRRDFEEYPLDSYLCGTWSSGHGWWYYYLYGMLVKIPHVTQIVIVFGIVYIAYRVLFAVLRVPCCFDKSGVHVVGLIVFTSPPLTLFLLVCSQDEFSIHFRYILPCLPFFIILGCIAVLDCFRSARNRKIILSILILSSINNLRHFPHFIPYFNELSGGPTNGWKHMLGSSYDWGQDMLFIKDYLEEHDIPISDVRINDHGYRYWECIYPDIWERQEGPFKYDLVSANVLTRPEKGYLKRLEAGEPTRICYTAWLFPIKDDVSPPN